MTSAIRALGRSADVRDDESGFGLIEVVISMLVLAVLAIAFLPVLVAGIKQSSANATLATATQLVNERLQRAQGAGTACADVAALAGSDSFTDEYGVDIAVTTEVGTCPSGPGTVAVTVRALRAADASVLVEATTLVLVR